MTIATTTHATTWHRPAAPDRPVPQGSVAPPLSPFGPRRPASTVRRHLATWAAEAIV
jgi:hypothetical protein